MVKPCPICGRTMRQVAAAGSPPWLCRECSHAFWECELTREARSAFRAQHRDWGAEMGLRRSLADARAKEAQG